MLELGKVQNTPWPQKVFYQAGNSGEFFYMILGPQQFSVALSRL